MPRPSSSYVIGIQDNRQNSTKVEKIIVRIDITIDRGRIIVETEHP